MSVSGTWYLSGLWPPMAAAVDYLLQYAAYYSLSGLIVSGYRTPGQQAELYLQGRTLAEVANRVSKTIGVGGVVTNAFPGRSPHNYGLAVDFEGRDQASILFLARAIGFVLVNDDPAHIEWPGWRQLVGI